MLSHNLEKMKKKKPSKEQISALKYLILNSKDADDEDKKICFALIDASQGFTKPVYFTIKDLPIDGEIPGIDRMVSSVGSTHLDAIMTALGTKYRFSFHGGYFRNKIWYSKIRVKGKWDFTVWLSDTRYDRQATSINKNRVSRVELKDTLHNLSRSVAQ